MAVALKKVVFGLLLVASLLLSTFLLFRYYTGGRHWEVSTFTHSFHESNKKIINPDRGFYRIHAFRISDEEVDYNTEVCQKFMLDADYSLEMVQINLAEYAGKDISPIGIRHIEQLFDALAKANKHYIIRFLYDWDGENLEYEPEDINIILGHMKQMEEILAKYSDEIFVIQGLFVGNWGEMHGSRYLSKEQLHLFARTMQSITPSNTYLAVRTPVQWRMIVDSDDSLKAAQKDSLASRISLYNDGMMGNQWDYGTYSDNARKDASAQDPWNREDELAFQEQLCHYVPNGGEVIVPNPVNDFENAKHDLAQMHVTYLNRDYDQSVYEKWEKASVKDEGCFKGMDGLTYIERHLGYRILLQDVKMSYDEFLDSVRVVVSLRNEGFAPMYTKKMAVFYLVDSKEEHIVRKILPFMYSSLQGGLQASKTLPIEAKYNMSDLALGTYYVYFAVQNVSDHEMIEFANEEELHELGYLVGQIEIKR